MSHRECYFCGKPFEKDEIFFSTTRENPRVIFFCNDCKTEEKHKNSSQVTREKN